MTKSLELPVPADYRPSDGELDNFVYLVCKYTVGWAMRQCDLAVCVSLAGGKDAIVSDAGLSKLCEVTCEYLWDHVCGEPDVWTSEDLFEHIKPCLQNWYNSSTPEERASTT